MAEAKTALVTGCTPGGIGHALAIELHRRGMRVIATGRTLEKLADLQEIGIECVALRVDDEKSISACYEQVSPLLEGKGLHYLINNAGQTAYRPASETDTSQAKQMFDVNLFGVMSMTKTFLPHLIFAKGTIINMGSVASHLPIPFMSTYCASKAALFAYTESLRVELAPLHVKTTYVNVGSVKTNTNHPSTHYQLSENSFWYPVRDVFEKQQRSGGSDGTDVRVFAREMVDRVVKRRRDTMWIGDSAWACWLASRMERWLPWGWKILPGAFKRLYGMERVGVHGK